jgi:hypothetical protein
MRHVRDRAAARFLAALSVTAGLGLYRVCASVP